MTSDLPAAAAAIRSAQAVIAGVLVVMSVASIIAAPFVSDLLLGPSSQPLDLLVVTISSGFSAMTVLEQSILASFRRIRAIAIAAGSTCFVSPIVNGICFAVAGREGIIAGLFLSTLLVFVITWCVRRSTLRVLRQVRVHGRDRYKDSVRLSRFGAKVVTTNLLGALITIATVVLINEQLGEATVGHYRSVLVIAEGYTVAVSLAVQQDLFPRLTRAASDKEEFSGQVVEQIRLFITLYVPLALTLMVLAVPVLTILFSGEFIPAQGFLRWRLAGDLFRIVGSVLTTSLLARALLGRRLVAEVGGSLLWFAGTLIGVTAFGFAGIGPFFVASTVGYVLILDRLTASSLTRPHARRLRELVLLAGLTLLVPCVVQEVASTRVAVVVSACLLVPAGGYSLRSLRRIASRRERLQAGAAGVDRVIRAVRPRRPHRDRMRTRTTDACRTCGSSPDGTACPRCCRGR